MSIDAAEAEGLHFERELIDEFFAAVAAAQPGQPKLSEKDCEHFAHQILGMHDAEPVHTQGTASFTLVSPTKRKIVQFRRKASNHTCAHEDEMLALVDGIYSGIAWRRRVFFREEPAHSVRSSTLCRKSCKLSSAHMPRG